MKKFLIVSFLSLTIFLGINKIDALTKEDLSKIEEEYYKLSCTFKEGELPKVNCLIDNLIGRMVSFENSPYLIDEKEVYNEEDNYKHQIQTYQVPAEVFDNYINKRFKVTDSYIKEFRDAFNLIKNYSYKQINGKYYYTFEYDATMYGGYGSTTIDGFKGYKDLGNNYYQVYTYVAEDNEFVPTSNDVLGDDYIVFEGYNFEVIGGTSFKVYYTGTDLKFMSYQTLEKDDLAKKSTLLEWTESSKKEEINKPEENKDNNISEDKENTPEKNPGTGLFTGIGFLILIGILSCGLYKFMKRQNMFPQI